MPVSISWTLNVQVVGGPKISAYDTLTVEGYDMMEVVIPANSTDTIIDVQPDGGAQFLLLTASSYENLTYTVDADPNVPRPRGLLWTAHTCLLVPEQSSAWRTQKQFAFTNTGAENVTVSILVGRDATPPHNDVAGIPAALMHKEVSRARYPYLPRCLY